MRNVAYAVLLVASMSRAEESAAPSEGQGWSVVGARTAGQGGNVLEGGMGWPGVYVGFLHGLAPTLDLGVRGSFTYGLEGLVRQVVPGVKLQGLLKVRLADTGKVSLGLVAEPGPLFAFDGFGNTLVGFAIPVGLRLGIAAASALTLGVSFDLPMWVQFGGSGGLNLPILMGLGVEYFLRSDLALFFRTKMGPTLFLRSYTSAAFTFDATLGVGWKF